MIWCEPGTFMMGSPQSEVGRRAGEETQHKVTLTKGFFLGKYEVTQEEYEKVMGENPSTYKSEKIFNWNFFRGKHVDQLKAKIASLGYACWNRSWRNMKSGGIIGNSYRS
jgi:formylglycine-generating enzyme required for sulfatase activity